MPKKFGIGLVMDKWIAHSHKSAAPLWALYVDDPRLVDEAELHTKIYFPVKRNITP